MLDRKPVHHTLDEIISWFTELKTRSDPAELRVFLDRLTGVFGLILFLVTLAGVVAAPLLILALAPGTAFLVTAPLLVHRKGEFRELFAELANPNTPTRMSGHSSVCPAAKVVANVFGAESLRYTSVRAASLAEALTVGCNMAWATGLSNA